MQQATCNVNNKQSRPQRKVLPVYLARQKPHIMQLATRDVPGKSVIMVQGEDRLAERKERVPGSTLS